MSHLPLQPGPGGVQPPPRPAVAVVPGGPPPPQQAGGPPTGYPGQPPQQPGGPPRPPYIRAPPGYGGPRPAQGPPGAAGGPPQGPGQMVALAHRQPGAPGVPPQQGPPMQQIRRPGMPPMGPHPGQQPHVMGQQQAYGAAQQHPGGGKAAKKKKKLADKIVPQKVRELVPESQAYMDLLAFERKLDSTIMRKRLDIQEALKRPMKQKRKLRVMLSSTAHPAAAGKDGAAAADDGSSPYGAVGSWELRVEGRLVDEDGGKKGGGADSTAAASKRKFSSFFKSLVIELDKVQNLQLRVRPANPSYISALFQSLYGPDNHLVEWHRTGDTKETDGFQVKRPGNKNVRFTILLLLDHQPLQFQLDQVCIIVASSELPFNKFPLYLQRLARLLGIHTQTRPVIISALWQYIKTHKLQVRSRVIISRFGNVT